MQRVGSWVGALLLGVVGGCFEDPIEGDPTPASGTGLATGDPATSDASSRGSSGTSSSSTASTQPDDGSTRGPTSGSGRELTSDDRGEDDRDESSPVDDDATESTGDAAAASSTGDESPLEARCGDGEVENDEACDDGNDESEIACPPSVPASGCTACSSDCSREYPIAASEPGVRFDGPSSGQLDSAPSDIVGWTFTPRNQALVVTHLGFYDDDSDGLAEEHPVGLYRVSDESLLAEVTVASGTDADLLESFRYVALGEPIVLEVGVEYVVIGVRHDADDRVAREVNNLQTPGGVEYGDYVAENVASDATLAFTTEQSVFSYDGMFGATFLGHPDPR